jgi:hypothetical protein
MCGQRRSSAVVDEQAWVQHLEQRSLQKFVQLPQQQIRRRSIKCSCSSVAAAQQRSGR